MRVHDVRPQPKQESVGGVERRQRINRWFKVQTMDLAARPADCAFSRPTAAQRRKDVLFSSADALLGDDLQATLHSTEVESRCQMENLHSKARCSKFTDQIVSSSVYVKRDRKWRPGTQCGNATAKINHLAAAGRGAALLFTNPP